MKQLLLSSVFISIIGLISAQNHQNEQIKDFTTGNYSVFKVVKKSYTKTVFEVIKKKWPIEVIVTNNRIEKVLLKRAGIIDELYQPDVPSYPSYFGFNDVRITYINGVLFYYKWTSNNKAEIKYALTNKGKSLSGKIDKYVLELESYILSIIKNQSGAKEQIKKDKAAQKEAERLANSLQNKKPLKIEFQLEGTPKDLGMGSIIKYGIIATLEDGSKLKTPNLGGKLPWSDFIIKVEGGTPNAGECMVLEDGSLIPNDQLVFNVKSKFHSSIYLKHKINLKYNKEFVIEYEGASGNDGRSAGLACDNCSSNGTSASSGYKGKNLDIKAIEVTSKAGLSYNKIEVIDSYSGKVLHKLKLGLNTRLVIRNIGGQGGYGGSGMASGSNYSANGGNGGNGGAGGDINITKNENTFSFMYSAENYGGYGGSGGSGDGNHGVGGSSGYRGSQGMVSDNIGFVIINW